MATLALTVVGGAIGGPIGAMIGAVIGQQADAVLFAPPRRDGPRLTDLAVQTSSYGTPIPQLFGSIRVAGTVIWATELRERQSNGGGGKGRPSTTSYSYSASFAVLLSGRTIRTVRRIWADGKLLRGAAGDWKVPTVFRLHLGSEDQVADPLIASAEGLAMTPASRGQAYAVFEDLPLAEFGNRIPSLTFEVEADVGPPPTRGHRPGLSPRTDIGGTARASRRLRGDWRFSTGDRRSAGRGRRRVDGRTRQRLSPDDWRSTGSDPARPGTGHRWTPVVARGTVGCCH